MTDLIPPRLPPILHVILDDNSGFAWNAPNQTGYRHATIDLPESGNLHVMFDVIVEYTRIVATALRSGDKTGD